MPDRAATKERSTQTAKPQDGQTKDFGGLEDLMRQRADVRSMRRRNDL